jgi:hypothetical protein
MLAVPKTKMYIHIVSQFAIKPVYTILNSCNFVIHMTDIWLWNFTQRGKYSFNIKYMKIYESPHCVIRNVLLHFRIYIPSVCFIATLIYIYSHAHVSLPENCDGVDRCHVLRLHELLMSATELSSGNVNIVNDIVNASVYRVFKGYHMTDATSWSCYERLIATLFVDRLCRPNVSMDILETTHIAEKLLCQQTFFLLREYRIRDNAINQNIHIINNLYKYAQ